MNKRTSTSESEQGHRDKRNQGEGDRESARNYNKATRKFVESGKVSEAAERAGGQDRSEAERAEREGKERARERDPAVHRDYSKPTRY